MKSKDDGIVTASCKNQKRKRNKTPIMDDDVKQEKVEIETSNHDKNQLLEKMQKDYEKKKIIDFTHAYSQK